ncbi:MAG: nuclease-related domain-containing protein [Pseudomonadota bacterium]
MPELNDIIANITSNPWQLAALVAVVLLLAGLLWRMVRGRRSRFEQVLADISFDRIESLVVPKADEGEIMLDYLLLTSQGLLVLEVKDVAGTIFGGDKLQQWSVMSQERRFTFNNPQPALYDRIAAIRQIVREVPVAGRILFLDGAEFAKGTPDLVTDLDGLAADFGEPDKNAARFKVEAFKPHWELIRRSAAEGGT